MATCPKGHESVSTDYCDECGTPIEAGIAPPPVWPAQTGTPAASGGSSPAAAPAATEKCPDCGTPRNGRFCEVDGYDFLATNQPAANQPAAMQSPAGSPPPLPAPASSEGLVNVVSPPPDGAPAPPVAGGLKLVVFADRDYHDRMAAVDDPDAESVAFPVYCPERRFDLADGQQLLIGRRSKSRGIEPNVDLTGPPEDVGVSHAHAVLMSTPDGGWQVIDLGSSNGTYLNDSTDALKANVPTPVKPGDRIHVGAWTTLSLQGA